MKTRLKPSFRVGLLLTILNLAWMSAAWLWVSRENWLWITPVALSINFLLLTYDQVLRFSKIESQPLAGQDPWGLLKMVHELSQQMGLTEPRVFLIEHPSAQVFSYGKTAKSMRLFITEGALKLLNPRELRAVIVFQLLAMKSSYGILNYWLGAVIDLLMRVGLVFEKTFALIFGWSPQLATGLVSPWAWLLHHVLISPADFEKLDRETAAKIESPEDLARALWKMEAYAQTQPWADPWVVAHMCMVSPLNTQIFRVQPTLKGRIKQLLGRYPL